MNSLNINLKGKKVWVNKDGELRCFICEDGFGCSPFTNGRKIYGKWEAITLDGIPCGKDDVINGQDIVRLADELNRDTAILDKAFRKMFRN